MQMDLQQGGRKDSIAQQERELDLVHPGLSQYHVKREHQQEQEHHHQQVQMQAQQAQHQQRMMMMMTMSNNGMPSASMEQAARRMSMAAVACAGSAGQGLGQPPPTPFTAAQQQALMRLTGGLQYNHMTVNANMSMPMHVQPYQYQYQHALMAQMQAQAHHAQAQRQVALGSGAGLRYAQHGHTPAMSHAAAAAVLPFQHSSSASIIHDKDHEELHRRHHADQQQQQQKPHQAHTLAHAHHHHTSQGIGIGLPTPPSRSYHFLGGEPTNAYRIVTQSQVAQLGGTPISAKLPTPAVPKQSHALQSVAEGLFAGPTAVLASKPFGAVGSASDSPVKHEQGIIIRRGACLNMQDSSSPLRQYTHIETPQGNTSVIMKPGSSPASNTHAALQHQHVQGGLSSASFAANAGSERAGGNADGNGVPSTSQHATMATPSAASTRSSVTPPLLEIDNTRKTTHPSRSQMSYGDRLSDANSNSGNQNDSHTNANAIHVLPSSSTFAFNTQDATTQPQSHHSQERRNAQSTGGNMVSPTSATSSTSVLSLSSPVTDSHTMPRRKSTNTTNTRMDKTRNGNNNNPTAASLPMEDRRQTGSKVPSIRRMTVKKPALTVDTTSHAGPVNSMQAAPILVASPVRRQQSIIRQPNHQQRQALYEQQQSRPLQELPPQAQMMQMQPMVQQGENVYGSIAVQSTQGVSVQYPAYTVAMPQISTPAMYAPTSPGQATLRTLQLNHALTSAFKNQDDPNAAIDQCVTEFFHKDGKFKFTMSDEEKNEIISEYLIPMCAIPRFYESMRRCGTQSIQLVLDNPLEWVLGPDSITAESPTDQVVTQDGITGYVVECNNATLIVSYASGSTVFSRGSCRATFHYYQQPHQIQTQQPVVDEQGRVVGSFNAGSNQVVLLISQLEYDFVEHNEMVNRKVIKAKQQSSIARTPGVINTDQQDLTAAFSPQRRATNVTGCNEAEEIESRPAKRPKMETRSGSEYDSNIIHRMNEGSKRSSRGRVPPGVQPDYNSGFNEYAIPGPPVRDTGLSDETMRVLEIGEAVDHLGELICFSLMNNLSPLEALEHYATLSVKAGFVADPRIGDTTEYPGSSPSQPVLA